MTSCTAMAEPWHLPWHLPGHLPWLLALAVLGLAGAAAADAEVYPGKQAAPPRTAAARCAPRPAPRAPLRPARPRHSIRAARGGLEQLV